MGITSLAPAKSEESGPIWPPLRIYQGGAGLLETSDDAMTYDYRGPCAPVAPLLPPREDPVMRDPAFRLFALFLFFAIVTLGCGKTEEPWPGPPPKQGGYNYGYGPPDMPAVAARFHEDPPANRSVTSDKVPLTFVDLDGKKVDLADYRGKANVVLVVTKGMPQSPGGVFCPGCLAQMNAMVANHAEFKKRDATVLVVFPGPSEKASEFLTTAKARDASQPSPIPLLLDKDLVAVELLGIRGDLAKPATYILDKKGNVVYAFVGEHTTDRPSVKALLGQLDKLNAKK